jgi:hypothetical protein
MENVSLTSNLGKFSVRVPADDEVDVSGRLSELDILLVT